MTTLSENIDRLYQIRQDRYTIQRSAAKLEEEEKALKSVIQYELEVLGIQGAVGDTAKFVLVEKEIPFITDWSALYKHIADSKQFHLLQKRLSEPAVAEMWSAGVEIPGVEKGMIRNVSLTLK